MTKLTLSRSVPTKDANGRDIVQLVRQGHGMDTASVIGVIYDDDCNAVEIAGQIVELWNRQQAAAPGISTYEDGVEDGRRENRVMMADILKEPSTLETRRDTLFGAIAHGDETHREWLRAAIVAHFGGKPVSPPAVAAALPVEPELAEMIAWAEGRARACRDNPAWGDVGIPRYESLVKMLSALAVAPPPVSKGD